jgi:hypothetical protein
MKKWLAILLMFPALSFAKVPPNWEEIKAPGSGLLYGYVYRMSVPHGWLVYTLMPGGAGGGTIFFPDENHEWVLEK